MEKKMDPGQVGIALISVGAILLLISIFSILIGQYRISKKTVTRKIQYHDARALADTQGGMRLAHIPFKLKYDTAISGKIAPTHGAFEFYIHDFFGWIPGGIPGQWAQLSYVKELVSGPGNETKFETFLEPGDYCLFFRTNAQLANADIELKYVYHMKSLKQLVDVGLTILQVAIPILVTGFIIYVGL